MLIDSIKKAKTISSWTVFVVAMIIYYFSVERTGSLWDVGEFILGAYKLEVVHPPGAPLFMLIGRIFAWFGEIFSDNPEHIAFAVNMMSAVCTAFGAFLIARIVVMLGKLCLAGRDGEVSHVDYTALTMAGIVGGLSMAFCSSIWFSAVEGEVYAMSTFFTIITLWSAVKWYTLPDTRQADKWIVFTAYLAGLSIGVHLLSLLTFPALGLLYYFKKYKSHNILGGALALIGGAAVVPFVQKVIIVGIPTLWKNLELPMVNSFGLPFHSGLVVALLLIAALTFFLLKWTHKTGRYNFQLIIMSALMIAIGFSTIGIIIIRANADTPINMNVPSDAMRVLPYLNREQYGERPLLYGPHFNARPKDLEREDRYGRVGDKYVKVDEKLDYIYESRDKIFLPRIGHTEGGRPQMHKQWYQTLMGEKFKGKKPSYAYNIKYMMKYQMGWMYYRYFMWNFAGRQNAKQGFQPWNVSDGHWISGIKPLDEMRLHNMSELTDTMKNHRGTNKYYFLPLIFGFIGLLFHMRARPKEFTAILILFLITGVGLIMYSNQPPREPRERDYVLVGSFFTFCIWIGLSVLSMTKLFTSKLKMNNSLGALAGGALVLSVPAIMAFQNFDDHSRLGHYASRDYAANFLNSVDENAIIFTYGDNDTYPLWYAQEVENIRRDVRVVNLSLIAVDWYIEKLRRRVNDSAPLKLTVPTEAYRGNKRNQTFVFNPTNPNDMATPLDAKTELAYVGSSNNEKNNQTIMRSRNLFIPINHNLLASKGFLNPTDTVNLVNRLNIKLPTSGQPYPDGNEYILKDQLAVLDVIVSNFYDRPIYFAVTCKNDKLMGLNDYMQLEGLGLKLTPHRNKSVRELSIYGSGRVAEDKVYNNIMDKWAFGGFDKKEAFIDESYAAEVQAMKIIMMRTAEEYLVKGDNQRASALADKFFASFPHMNFPYDDSVIPFIETFLSTGDKEKAKFHMDILATEIYQSLQFYISLDDDDKLSFMDDIQYSIRGASQVLKLVDEVDDPAYSEKTKVMLTEMLEKFDLSEFGRR